MNTSAIVTTLIVIVIVLGAGYYFFYMPQAATAPTTDTTDTTGSTNTGDTSGTPANTNTGSNPAAAPLVSTATNAKVGSYLAATTNGMTLYTFTSDKPGVSTCTGQCEVNWPPYTIAPGASLLGSADVHGTFGTFTRADGSTQLTYNGSPLYFYIKDTKSGDVTGQGVGGVWFVVKP